MDDGPKPKGKNVLLARSTGENKGYWILGRAHETPVNASTGSSAETPATEPKAVIPTIDSFSASVTQGNYPLTSVLSWTYSDAQNRVTKIGIDYGEGAGEEFLDVGTLTSTNIWDTAGTFTVNLRLYYVDSNNTEQVTEYSTLTIETDAWGFLANKTQAEEDETITFTWYIPDTFATGDTIVIDWKDGSTSTFTTAAETTTHAYNDSYGGCAYLPTLTYTPVEGEVQTVDLMNGPIVIYEEGQDPSEISTSYATVVYECSIASSGSVTVELSSDYDSELTPTYSASRGEETDKFMLDVSISASGDNNTNNMVKLTGSEKP